MSKSSYYVLSSITVNQTVEMPMAFGLHGERVANTPWKSSSRAVYFYKFKNHKNF